MNNRFAKLVPELPVADVAAAQAYYRDMLGFRTDWIWDDDFGSVSNGEARIFFARKAIPVSGFTLYLFVEDADAVYDACTSTGAEVVEPIASMPWGMREFVVRDINGHLLRIGHGEESIPEIERFHTGESGE